MSLLAALTTDSTIEDEKDVVGGGSRVRESGLYPMKVALAYLSKSAGGALSLNLTFKDDAGEVRQQFWMTSGTAKGGKNYYEKDGKRNYLPGFLHANALALLTVGKEISQLDTEDKVVNLYSYEAKAEVPTKVAMVMDLLDKEALVGLIKQTVDKNVKNDAGAYVPSGETREENEVDKVFRASDRMTTAEIRAEATEATFVNLWDQKWTGKVKDKSTKGAAGVAGAPQGAAAPAANRPKTSLFG